MSQPDVIDNTGNSLFRTNTGTQINSTRIGMTMEERDSKINQLENFLRKIEELEDNIDGLPTLEIEVVASTEKRLQLYLSYFIGRLNPPHNGHILALETLIHNSLQKDPFIPPLILLGSGPKGARTLDNPIPFDLKKDFIIYKLGELGITPDQYIIEEMSNTTQNIRKYISKQLNNISKDDNLSLIDNVEIVHIAGDKEDDRKKLAFALNAAKDEASNIWPSVPIEAKTDAITPAASSTGLSQAMSATQVRKDAYKTLLGNPLFTEEGWLKEYGSFYGRYSKPIFYAILEPGRDLSLEQINIYIEDGSLPTTKKIRKSSGGFKRKSLKKKKHTRSKKYMKKRRTIKRK
jgi:hypothetical protein